MFKYFYKHVFDVAKVEQIFRFSGVVFVFWDCLEKFRAGL